jgi:glycosyltransferase involved in cell wall biosynthesis
VEALACGLPVVAFDTGALRELIPPGAGAIVAYGGDPWKLDPPDLDALARAAAETLKNQQSLSLGARNHAQESLGLDLMVQRYLDFFTHA